MSYHDRPEISATQLKLIESEGWRTYEARYITGTLPPREASPAMEWGNVLETVMLEPAKVDRRVYVGPSKDEFDDLLVTDADLKAYIVAHAVDAKGATTKAAKIMAIHRAGHSPPIWDVIRAESEQARGDRIEITKQQYADALEIVELARRDENARWLFADNREVQPERFWEHSTGLRCRAKADVWLPEQRTLIDVKTTRWGNAESIKRDFLNLGYWLQDVHYSQGFEAERFYFVACSSVRPWRIFTFAYSPYERRRFARYHDGLMTEFKRRLDAGDWSEETEGVILEASAPDWWHAQKGRKYGE